MNGARSFLAGALALASMGLGAGAPRWVVAQGLDAETYPLTTHLTGFGISQAEGDEGSKRRQAMAMAREALAASIRTRVQSEFVKQVQVKDQAVSSFAKSMVSTRSSLELEGLDRFEYYLDAKKGLYYCLAVLDRDTAGKRLKETLAKQCEESRIRFLRAKAAPSIPALLEVRALVRKIEEGIVVYGVLARTYPAQLTYPSLGEVGEELRKVFAAQKGLDGPISGAVLDLAANLPDGLRVLVDRVSYGDTPFCGSFSSYAAQAVSERLVSLGGVRIVDKSALKDLFREQGFSGEPAEVLDSQVVVRGTYVDLGPEVKLVLKATSVRGEELAESSAKLPAGEITRAGLTLVPENYEAAKKALAIYSAKVQDAKLQVKLKADRGEGGIYRKGDKLFLFLQANLDCYVRIIYHQVDGTLIQIFPNRFHPDSRIEKGRVYQIPPENPAFHFEISEPFGVEMIKVFASTVPLDTQVGERLDQGFRLLKEDPSALVRHTRGITVTQAQAMVAEDTAVINTFGRER